MSSRLSESCLPDIRLSIVVLPHPEGPKIAVKVLGEKRPVLDFKISLMPSC